eukprot:2287124-Ditylum_brightwellii.AAC.1
MDVSPLCHLCKREPEIVAHIISSCTPIAKKKHSLYHNAVATYIHWCMLQGHEYKVSDQWWLHKPVKTTHMSEDVEVNWDKTTIIDQCVKANRPGIAIIDKKPRSLHL